MTNKIDTIQKEKIYWAKRLNNGVTQWYMQKSPFPKDSKQCEAFYEGIENEYWISEQLLDTTSKKAMMKGYKKILKENLYSLTKIQKQTRKEVIEETLKNIKGKMQEKAKAVPISEGSAVVKWKDIEDIFKLFKKIK